MGRVMSLDQVPLKLVALAVVLLALPSAHSTQRQRPNIVLFSVDDLGWNDVGYNGAEYSTPHIDALAEKSLRLSRYYTPNSCSPSRAAMLTSRYPHRLGLAHTVVTNGFDIGVDPNMRTLAAELKDAGYATHMVGKWDIGMARWQQTPTFRGFDSFLGFYNAFEDHYTHSAQAVPGVTGTSPLPYEGVDLRNGTASLTGYNGTFGNFIFIERAVEVIKYHTFQEKPLFLYVANQVVHSPLDAPARFVRQCSRITRKSRRMLCALTKVADESLANVTQALQAAGQWNNTLLLFMTDNGGQTSAGSSNWPLRGGKLTLYEGGVRGLAFLHGPGLGLVSQTVDTLVHAVDWLPTLVSGVAGGHLESAYLRALDGINLWQSLLSAGKVSQRREALLQFDPAFSKQMNWYQTAWPGQAAIIRDSWKLIVGPGTCSLHPISRNHLQRCDDGWFSAGGIAKPPPLHSGHFQLYHVIADPQEQVNLASMFPEIVSYLLGRIRKYAGLVNTKQSRPQFEPISNPANYGGWWTPWLCA